MWPRVRHKGEARQNSERRAWGSVLVCRFQTVPRGCIPHPPPRPQMERVLDSRPGCLLGCPRTGAFQKDGAPFFPVTRLSRGRWKVWGVKEGAGNP